MLHGDLGWTYIQCCLHQSYLVPPDWPSQLTAKLGRPSQSLHSGVRYGRETHPCNIFGSLPPVGKSLGYRLQVLPTERQCPSPCHNLVVAGSNRRYIRDWGPLKKKPRCGLVCGREVDLQSIYLWWSKVLICKKPQYTVPPTSMLRNHLTQELLCDSCVWNEWGEDWRGKVHREERCVRGMERLAESLSPTKGQRAGLAELVCPAQRRWWTSGRHNN